MTFLFYYFILDYEHFFISNYTMYVNQKFKKLNFLIKIIKVVLLNV